MAPTTNGISIEKVISQCEFLKICYETRATLPEPLWYRMVSIVGRISPGGIKLVHDFSKDYPDYDQQKTDAKILHALDSARPYNCKNIKESLQETYKKDCGKSCSVKSPCVLFYEKNNEKETQRNSNDQKTELCAVTVEELLSRNIPPRENILTPWLPTQGLAMLYGYRGVGKTFIGIGIAVAVVSGGKFLLWEAPEKRPVLYIDGEMPAVVLQERFSQIIINNSGNAQLQIITPDFQSMGMPNLANLEGQKAIEPYLKDTSLVIIDNISTLCRHDGDENRSESWRPLQEWGLKLRSCGVSVLFIHHAGKGGDQRGTSKREDVLDTVICLKHPKDYTPEQGAYFEIHFDKARGIYGDDVKPFEAKLVTDSNGQQKWETKFIEDSLTQKVADLLNNEVPQKEIVEKLGVSKSTVSKHKKKAQELGLLN